MATTQAQEVQVNSANPSSAEQGTVDLDVEISGSGFDRSADVKFFPTGTSDPGGINVKKVKVRGSKKIIATIDVDPEAVVDDFDIEISLLRGRRGRGTTLFSVKKKSTDKTTTELIVFTGDLQGWAHVEGCCPNAGPNPLYTLTLTKDLVDDSVPPRTVYPADTHIDGYLFMNGWSFKGRSGYLVQFWHWRGVDGDPLTFEIICGTSDYDRKTRVLRVTCDQEPWWKDYNREIDMGPVSFEILRVPSRYCTPDICPPQP
jgi:hypothetical protein